MNPSDLRAAVASRAPRARRRRAASSAPRRRSDSTIAGEKSVAINRPLWPTLAAASCAPGARRGFESTGTLGPGRGPGNREFSPSDEPVLHREQRRRGARRDAGLAAFGCAGRPQRASRPPRPQARSAPPVAPITGVRWPALSRTALDGLGIEPCGVRLSGQLGHRSLACQGFAVGSRLDHCVGRRPQRRAGGIRGRSGPTAPRRGRDQHQAPGEVPTPPARICVLTAIPSA